MLRLCPPLALAIVVAVWLASLATYAVMPQKVPIHWNIRGEVDGYGDKSIAAFAMPAAMLGLWALFRALPWLSPRQFTIESFRSTYEFVVSLCMALFAYIHGLMLWAAMGGKLDLSRALVGGLCVFFALLGNVLGKVRRNFFVGVRTPWTLASERVWIDTHRLAARLFVAAGILGLVVCLAIGGPLAIASTAGLILMAAFVPAIYSLVHYKRLERKEPTP